MLEAGENVLVTRLEASEAERVMAEVPELRIIDDGLWQAVKALPDKQRQALAYHYVAGLPYAQIADILGGSTAAARRAAADGMKSMRTRMGASAPQKGSSR